MSNQARFQAFALGALLGVGLALSLIPLALICLTIFFASLIYSSQIR